MTDIVKFCEPKSDQLNNVDLIAGNRIIKVTKVKVTATGTQDCTVSYEGDNGKPWKPCKTTARIMLEKWGADIQNWVGKSLELFRDPEVVYGGKKEGGIRITAMSDIPADFETVVRISRGSTKVVKIKKLSTTAAAQASTPAATEPAAAAAIDPAVMTAGNAAAAKGVTAYVAWRDALAPAVKESIKPHNSDWSKVAKAADAKAADQEIPV